MAVAQVYTAVPNDVITAARWNNEFGNIYNNGTALAFPVTTAVSFNGNTITLDAAGASTLTSTSSTAFVLTTGAKSGTPNTTGKAVNVSALTFTDSNTAGSGTAASFAAVAIQRPILIAGSALVTTTDAATVYIANAPQASTNETITNPWALWIDDGAARFDGSIGGIGVPIVNEFRLTVTTGVPVTTSDVIGAGTIYLTPYSGRHISLYNGSVWKIYDNAQISLALTATSGKPYDVFVYDNAGTLTLETLVWTDDTTRATALAYQDGVLVKSGATTRRYVGTFYATGTNTTEDSTAKRNVWNYYNRVSRMLQAFDTANSWTYTTATWRQANANAANQLEFVVGVSEDSVKATVISNSSNSSGNIARSNGIGVDSTSVNSAVLSTNASVLIGAAVQTPTVITYSAALPAGRHTLVWLERSVATGTSTWYGDNNDIYIQSGIYGEVTA